MKRLLLAVVAFMGACSVSAQDDPVLMTIDGHEIHRSEFEYIYNKNSAASGVEQKSLNEYVELFVNFKLKVYKAMSLGIDTTESFRSELEGYRRQLAMPYLCDETVSDEAAKRYYDKLSSRNMPARVGVRRIFRRMPQNITKTTMRRYEAQMDSVYAVLQSAPESFEALQQSLSDDKSVLDVSFLQNEQELENTVMAMKPGEVSKPFYTPSGLQIVKVVEREELPSFDDIKQDIKSRLKGGGVAGMRAVAERLKSETSFSENGSAVDALLKGGHTDEWLFCIDGNRYTGAMFRSFASSYPRGVKMQYDMFVMKSLIEYEDSRLESKYPEFGNLMKEYREGMLMFEVSNNEVWLPSATDEAGREAYFESHRSQYKWNPYKYLGVAVRCKDEATLKKVKKELKKTPTAQWPDSVDAKYNAGGERNVVAKYALFSKGDDAVVDFFVYGAVAPDAADDYPCAYVTGKKQKGPASAAEVGDVLLEDYRNYLEEAWIKRLRRESRVEINQEVLKTVNNHSGE